MGELLGAVGQRLLHITDHSDILKDPQHSTARGSAPRSQNGTEFDWNHNHSPRHPPDFQTTQRQCMTQCMRTITRNLKHLYIDCHLLRVWAEDQGRLITQESHSSHYRGSAGLRPVTHHEELATNVRSDEQPAPHVTSAANTEYATWTVQT